MTLRSALALFWRDLAKPREPLLHSILRRRATRRALDFDERDVSGVGYYDKAIRAYLALWLVASSQEEHYRTARDRFGLDEETADFVDQVLWSAALETLPNWVNGQDDPWWMAGWHLSQSRERYLLNPLRWQLQEEL